jgi:hypothetical protein
LLQVVIDLAALQMMLGMLTGWLDRWERESIAYLIEENRLLRRQLGGRRPRLTDDDRRRLAARAYRVGRAALREIATIATPDTLLRWHRQLIARKWTYARRSARRGVFFEIRQLVVRMATDNPTWGYTRMQGASERRPSCGSLTIRRILKAAGLPPIPQRPTSWQMFLHAHWGAIAGADFFTTEVWTWRGLVTYYTVFVIDLASRRVQILGSTPHPEAVFMQQTVRTLMAEDGAVRAPHLLICDRDRKWSGDVRRQLRDAGIRVVFTPERAQCERVRGTLRAVDQRRMPGSADSDRGSACPAGGGGVRRALSRRTESSGTRQSPHHGPADHPDGEWRATPSTARRVAQFL